MDNVFSAMKAQQWERAKGEMRAMVALLGSQPAQYSKTGAVIENDRWLRLRAEVETFIAQIEDNGLHE